MRTSRSAVILAFGLMLLGSAPVAMAGAVEPPRLMKPRPAPPVAPGSQPLPPAVFDPALAIGGEEVKAREIDTRLNVDVMVNGRGPYRFIVDSGADTSAVGVRIANALELPLGTPVVLNGMTGRNIVDRVHVAELSLGPNTIRNLQLPALREADLGGDGMVGIDALVRQRLLMDFDKHLIKVEDARKPAKPIPGEIVVTARRQRGQLILTEVRASGVRLDAVIDTGTEVSIGNMALRQKLIRRRVPITTVEAIGVTGEKVKMELARINELQLGPVLLRDVPIAFADVPPFTMWGIADEPALLLGTDLMSTFRRVSLDFWARKIRFQLRRCTTEGVLISTSQTGFYSRLSATGAGTDACQH